MAGGAPLSGLRECSADASLNVLGDDAHIGVQEQGLQLPINPERHLGPVQGCRADLRLEVPAQITVPVGYNWPHGTQELTSPCHCEQIPVRTHVSAVLEGRVARGGGTPEMVCSPLGSCRLCCEVQRPPAELLSGWEEVCGPICNATPCSSFDEAVAPAKGGETCDAWWHASPQRGKKEFSAGLAPGAQDVHLESMEGRKIARPRHT